MQGLSIQALSDLLDRSIEQKNIHLTQNHILGLPERMLIELIDSFDKNDSDLILKQEIIEFLINIRRYHFTYFKSNELWGLMEQHLQQDLEASSFESGPFGMFIDINGIQNTGYSMIPITKVNLNNLKPTFIPLFDAFISTMPKRYMRVVFFDSTKSMRYKFPFQFNITNKFLTSKETSEIELFSGFLPTYLNTLKESKPDEDLIELRKMAITFIRNVEPDLFRLSFEIITEKLDGDFQFDMFHFLHNSFMIREHLKLQKEKIRTQLPKSDYGSFVEVDFSGVNHSNPNPDIISYTKEMMDDEISQLSKKEKNHPKYQYVIQQLEKTNQEQVIILSYNRTKREIHDFEFDITMMID